MKNLIFIILISLGFSEWVLAQYEVKGVVTEKAQQPVSYAAVALQSVKDSSIVKGAVTDEHGAFQISNAAEGTYFVSVQYVGFHKQTSKPFTLSANNPSENLDTLAMEEDIQQLSEVTVKAQRPLVEQKVDRMVLNVENSVITKGNKVNDLLQYAPLVQVDVTGGISVANNSNVLILVDGRQMGQATLNSFLQNFSAEDILKVEVITNPSARYDASFKSVINIITKKSLERGFKGRISSTYSQGKRGRFTPDASLNYRSARWNVFSSVSYSRSDYLRNQSIERFFPDGSALDNENDMLNSHNNGSAFMGIDYFPSEKHVVGIRLNGNWKNNDGYETTVSSFHGTESLPDSLLLTKNTGNWRAQTYDLNFNYTGKFDSTGRELTVNVTQTFLNKRSLQNINYQELNIEGNPIGNPTILRIVNPIYQNSFIAQADYTLPTSKARWEFGSKYIFVENDNELRQEDLLDGTYRLDSSFSNADNYREYTFAAYANYSRSLKSGWSIQAGLRAEQTQQNLVNSNISRDYFGLFPSAGISRKFDKGHSWGITYSRKIGRPNLRDLVPFRYVVDPFSIIEGNPKLKPQFSNTLDTYLNLGSITLFGNYTQTRDLITVIMQGDEQTKIYTQITGNLDLVHDAYIGVNWSNEITKWWQTNSNVMLSGSVVNTTIDEVPEFKANGMGVIFNSTNLFVLPNSWKVELRFNYNSPNRWNIFKTGVQYWASAGVNKEVFKHGHIRLSVEDIFRTRFQRFSTAYGFVDINSIAYMDTQRVKFSFSYNFGKKTVKDARRRKLGNEDIKSRMDEN